MNSRAVPSALRVGVLVVIFFGLMYSAFIFLGGRFTKHGKTYYVSMTDAGGLTKGTSVALAGVRIGTVRVVQLLNPRSIKLTLSIDDEYALPVGSTATVPSSFIGIGESALVIVPPEELRGDLPAGSTIEGSHPGPLDGIFPDTKTTIKTFNETLAAARDLLRDQDLKHGVKGLLETTQKTLATSQETLKQFSNLASETQHLLAANQGEISQAMRNASLAMADVQKGTHLAYKLLRDGHYQEHATKLLASLDATSAKTQKLMDSLDGFVNDPKLRSSLTATMQNAQDLTAQGKEIASSAAIIAKNGETASQNAIALTSKASEVADEAKNLVVKLEGLVDKVQGKVEKTSGAIPRIGPIHAEIDQLRDTHPNYNRTDVNFMVPVGQQRVYFGLFDAFGSDKLNLQLGKPVAKNTILRYGAYAGKAGLGVDYQIAPRLGLVNDVYDTNKPRYDLRAKYEFGNGFVSWFGLDRIFDRNGIMIGVGIER